MLIEAAEKWLKEYGVDHIVITSQDRAAGFYEKLGYKLNPDADLSVYDHHAPKKDEEPKKPKKKSWLYLCTGRKIRVREEKNHGKII